MHPKTLTPDTPVAALILAGGYSQRMGKPKALLPTGNGVTFIQSLKNCLESAGITDCFFLTNVTFHNLIRSNFPNLSSDHFILNPWSEPNGRLQSVIWGLTCLKNMGFHGSVFLLNCDAPEVPRAVFLSLQQQISASSWACPTYQGKGGHPILLGSEVVRGLTRFQPWDFPSLREALQSFPKVRVEVPYPEILTNINTPEEWTSFLVNSTEKEPFYENHLG